MQPEVITRQVLVMILLLDALPALCAISELPHNLHSHQPHTAEGALDSIATSCISLHTLSRSPSRIASIAFISTTPLALAVVSWSSSL